MPFDDVLPDQLNLSADRDVADHLRHLIEQESRQELADFVEALAPGEIIRAVALLAEDERKHLLRTLGPEFAADLLDDLPDEQSADILDDIHPEEAAAIIEELDSDDRADVLREMEEEDAEAILKQLSPEDADETRQLISYAGDTAGGLMVTEFVAYPMRTLVDEVLEDLRRNREHYQYFNVQYFYVTDSTGVLKGVLRLRDLILSSRKRLIDDVMIRDPDVVDVNTPLRTIQGMFEVHSYSAMPVVDEAGRMVGAVLEKDVAEAARKSSSRTLLKLTGIFGGEELRSMPLSERLGKRLPWLLSIMALALCAAIVIALFEETVAVIPALVIFLPVVAGVSGSSGNQAVGLTLREMALGAVRPGDLFHVLSKEARLGIINGVVLGLVLAGIGLSWKQEQGAKFGLLLGLALAINSVVSVCLGGILPLVLRRINIDPAMASGPITTMMADACGFFLVLGFATMALL